MEDPKEVHKYKDILCRWIRSSILSNVSFSQLIYRFNAIPILKILASYFMDIEKIDSKVCVERQKTQNSQHNIKREQIWKIDATQSQGLLET